MSEKIKAFEYAFNLGKAQMEAKLEKITLWLESGADDLEKLVIKELDIITKEKLLSRIDTYLELISLLKNE